MKVRKNRRGVSTVIAVLLMIVIVVAAAVIVWAFVSGFIGGQAGGATTPTKSIIQINSAVHAATSVSVQLVTPGTDPTIKAIYITKADGTGELKTENLAIATLVVRGDIAPVNTPSAYALQVGDVVKVVCADGGAASTSVT